MGLPVEIRLEILRFLLPDLPTVPHRGPPNMRQHESEFAHYADQLSVAGGGTDREKVVRIAGMPRVERQAVNRAFQHRDGHFDPDRPYWPLRSDGEDTSTAILRANSQLYREGREIMYDRSFEVYFRGSIFELSDHCHDWLYNSLEPSWFFQRHLPLRHMKALEIVIETKCLNCSCSEGLEDEDFDCSSRLCFPGIRDEFTTLATLVSQWPGLERLMIDFTDYSVDDEEVKETAHGTQRLMDLTKVFLNCARLERSQNLVVLRW